MILLQEKAGSGTEKSFGFLLFFNSWFVLEMPKSAKIKGRYIKTIENIADNMVYYIIGNILISIRLLTQRAIVGL